MNRRGNHDPVIVGILYPHWYHPETERAEVEEELRALDPCIDVLWCGYEESTERRSARSSGAEPPDAAPVLSAEQRSGFGVVDIAIAMDLPLEVAGVAPQLRWVQGVGAGVGQLLSAGLSEDDIALTTSAGVSAVSISEFVIGRLLQIYKDTDRLGALQASHKWTAANGRTLAGSTVGLVGLGAIGQELALRLSAFGVEVIGCRRRPDAAGVQGVNRVVGPDELDGLLGAADVVVSAVPETPDTVDMFDRDRFAAMRPGAVFVNVGRGSAVVEADLIAALETDQLSAAVLDVARVEPLPSDDPLWDAPRLYLSPHSSASADDYMRTLHRLFRDNVRRYLDGEPLRNEVDTTLGY